jgi:hypothetical protein
VTTRPPGKRDTRAPKGRMPQSDKERRTDEPPLTLYPLDFETALKGALEAGPYPGRKKRGKAEAEG